MNINVQYRLKSNYNYIRFLRENSFWYKYLNRDSIYFDKFDREMRSKYKLTTKDKLDNISKNMDKISQIIDIFS